ncbi:hypothetical protein HD806DRAFT_518903 [Xylariaceae sp. AK1471]|nr:hypothetical protein HD806DRAFT_518903 [Xylariaceae sp. AK1471]
MNPLPKDKYKTGVNPDDEHTTVQVSQVIDDSINKYQIEDIKRLWGRIRLAFRSFVESDKNFYGWLGLFPSESPYLSVVAAIWMRNVAEKVLEGLYRIPAILSGVQRVLKIFNDDDELHGPTRQIYMSILAALRHMLECLQRARARKIFTAAFMQDMFEMELEQKIKSMEDERNKLNEQAQLCHMEAMNKLQRVSAKDTAVVQKEMKIVG